MMRKKIFWVNIDRNYVLIKDFNTFMYDHTLHQGRKHLCQYCLQALSSQQIIKSY